MLRQHAPKLYIFISFVKTVKSRHSPSNWKITYVTPFLRVSQNWHIKRFKSLCGFGEHCLKIRDVCGIDFKPCITWSLFTLKASNLVKPLFSTWSFMWWCQFIDWLKFEIRHSSQRNLGMAYTYNAWMMYGIEDKRKNAVNKVTNNYNWNKKMMQLPRGSCWAIHLAAAIAISLSLIEYSMLLAFSLL